MKDKENAINTIRNWAREQEGAPYVYGGTGAICTPGYRQARARQYPAYEQAITDNCPVLKGRQSGCGGCLYAGRPCYDCAQLTRRALQLIGISLPSGASSQWKAACWARKDRITPEAAQQLCLVFRESGDPDRPMKHVGLCLGDGRVLDARGHGEGVLLRSIGSYPWTHYALPEALYGELEAALMPGDLGEEVRKLQLLLIARGHPLPKHGADGIFGPETLAALRAFRQQQGLAEGDGADRDILARLERLPDPLQKIEQRVTALEVAVDALREVGA